MSRKIHETRQGTKLRCRLMRQGKKLRWTMTVLQWVVLCSQTSTHSSLLKRHLISITASHDFLSLNIEMRRGQILLAIAKKKGTVSCANSQYKSLFGFFQWHAFRKLINKISKQKLLKSRKRAALPHKTPNRRGFVTAKKRNCQNNRKQSRIFSFELVNFLMTLFSSFLFNYVIINSPCIYSSLHLNKIQLSTTSILKSLFEAKKKKTSQIFLEEKKKKWGKEEKVRSITVRCNQRVIVAMHTHPIWVIHTARPINMCATARANAHIWRQKTVIVATAM